MIEVRGTSGRSDNTGQTSLDDEIGFIMQLNYLVNGDQQSIIW